MIDNTAFIFPAFITEYTKKELDFIEANNIDFSNYLRIASKVIGKEIPDFSYTSPGFKNDELLSQIIAYLFSCAFNDILQEKGIKPEYTAGYSMGIYANLYAVKSVNLEQGLLLIHKAYNLVKTISDSGVFGMGAIIGLTPIDIEKLIKENKLDIEVINVNNEHSLVIAGKEKEVEFLLENAKGEGAFSVGKLTVNTPYHSKYLFQFAPEFEKYVQGLNILDPSIPIISTYDQRKITRVIEVKKELVFNLTEKINWHKTMHKLLQLNSKTFYECGAGKDLSKIARFINGDYKIKAVYTL